MKKLRIDLSPNSQVGASATTIQSSVQSVSRHDSNTVRLYQQGVYKSGQYLRRWLGWAGLSFILLYSYAVMNPSHSATPNEGDGVGLMNIGATGGGYQECSETNIKGTFSLYHETFSYEHWSQYPNGIDDSFKINITAEDNLDFSACQYDISLEESVNGESLFTLTLTGDAQLTTEGANTVPFNASVDLDQLRVLPTSETYTWIGAVIITGS